MHPLELYEPDDSAKAIISLVCQALSDCDGLSFKLCFGDGEEIELPIACEFCIFLEQLPDVMAASKNENVTDFKVDFFEQGFNFVVLVKIRDGMYHITYDTSNTNISNAVGYVIPCTNFDLMLEEIGQKFAYIAVELLPELVHNASFAQWCKDIGVSIDL